MHIGYRAYYESPSPRRRSVSDANLRPKPAATTGGPSSPRWRQSVGDLINEIKGVATFIDEGGEPRIASAKLRNLADQRSRGWLSTDLDHFASRQLAAVANEAHVGAVMYMRSSVPSRHMHDVRLAIAGTCRTLAAKLSVLLVLEGREAAEGDRRRKRRAPKAPSSPVLVAPAPRPLSQRTASLPTASERAKKAPSLGQDTDLPWHRRLREQDIPEKTCALEVEICTTCKDRAVPQVPTYLAR